MVITNLERTLFKKCITVSKACPQRNKDKSMKLIMDRAISNRILFLFLDILLSWDTPGGVHWETIAFFLSYFRNSALRFFSPQSNRRTLMGLPVCFSISCLNSLNLSKASDLCFIRNTYPYHDRSSVKIITIHDLYIKWATHVSVYLG